MSDKRLPSAFAELEPFADKWCLPTEPERWEARLATPMPKIREFYDAFSPRFEEFCVVNPDRLEPAVRDRLVRRFGKTLCLTH